MSSCPGFGRGFSPSLARPISSARRARQVCRARWNSRMPAGVARAMWHGAPPTRCAGAGSLRLRGLWRGAALDLGGQIAANDGGVANRPSARPFDFHAADADLACRHDVAVRCPRRWPAGVAFGRGRIHAGRLLPRWVPVCMRPLRGQVRSLGLVFAVNPGAGTAHALCVRCASGLFAATGLHDKFPLHCADSSRGKFLGPAGPPRCCGLRCGAPGALPDRITPRPRWARTWKPREESS